MNIRFLQADYSNTEHGQHICKLLDIYARDPMGGGVPLMPEVKNNLITALAKLPHAISLLAYHDAEPAGLVNCFETFSTFACKPILNIHDFMVVPEYRGKGLSQQMLKKTEDIARNKNCCKLTLEVLSNNRPAKIAYTRFGFGAYQLDPLSGTAEFWQKTLE